MKKLHPKQVPFYEATHVIVRVGRVKDQRLAGFNHIEYARECAAQFKDDPKVAIREVDKTDPAALFPPGHIKPA